MAASRADQLRPAGFAAGQGALSQMVHDAGDEAEEQDSQGRHAASSRQAHPYVQLPGI